MYKVFDKIQKYDRLLFWLNVILFSSFLTLMSTASFVHQYEVYGAGNTDVKAVFFNVEVISLIFSILIIYGHSKMFWLFSKIFNLNIKKTIQKQNLLFLPFTIGLSLFSLYHLFYVKLYNSQPTTFIFVLLLYTYLFISQIVISVKFGKINIFYSILVSSMTIIFQVGIFYFLYLFIADMIFGYYSLKDQWLSLRHGTWGIG